MDEEQFDLGITLLRRSVALTPSNDPSRLPRLAILGASLSSRFKRSRDIEDLNDAITALREAVSLTPSQEPNRPSRLGNLASALSSRFERLGDITDIHEAISALREAVDRSAARDPFKAARLTNLGVALGRRFLRLGDVEDIDGAVTAQRSAVALTRRGHPSRCSRLSNLGSALARRFERLGNVQDIVDAVEANREAVNLVTQGHPDRPTMLSNLATSLSNRLEHFGNNAAGAEDVGDSVDLLRESVELTEDSDSEKPSRLNNLGRALICHYDRTGSAEDLDEAVAVHQQAVSLTPSDHPDRPARLNNLSDALRTRFHSYTDPDDIYRALEAVQEAMDLSPPDHREQSIYGISLGHAYLCRMQCDDGEGRADSEAAISAYRAAALLPTGNPFHRLDACRHWGRTAFLQSRVCADVYEAYQLLMELIPVVAWLGGTVAERHEALKAVGRDVRNAAVMATMEGHLEKALEWLEEGRSIVWGQQLGLRTPVDDLEQKHPELATRIRHIASELDSRSTRRPVYNALPTSGGQGLLEQAAQEHRRLAERWTETIEEVRRIPEFEDFLRPRRIAALRAAARSGPIVVLNVWGPSCDAIILQQTGRVIHVPLDDLAEKNIQKLYEDLSGLLRNTGVLMRGSKGVFGLGWSGGLDKVLSVLWTAIVRPVLQALQLPVIESDSEPHPRLTWCAAGTLALLPLHAAGDYRRTERGHKASDFITSSYTTSLSTLLPDTVANDHAFHGLLAVSQPDTPGQLPLPSTTAEVAVIQKHFHGLPIQRLDGFHATMAHVQDGMVNNSWLHLACHAIQDRTDPMKSAFCLNDGQLELGEIIRRSQPHAEFAFLSACQTSSGNEALSDEAVHLAAGMQLAGYRSVIATMWSIKDCDAPVIADAVYRELVCNGRPDCSLAADALRRAVGRLRDDTKPESGALDDTWFLRWVPFIHMGV
ncbi:hypothetical protein DENSPDRAFT_821087 [Dentipellis sp. KUC8613]|nr:hypothetical protein DENSPDRAFT_821087 [Dentipellis sp. KUC8613]